MKHTAALLDRCMLAIHIKAMWKLKWQWYISMSKSTACSHLFPVLHLTTWSRSREAYSSLCGKMLFLTTLFPLFVLKNGSVFWFLFCFVYEIHIIQKAEAYGRYFWLCIGLISIQMYVYLGKHLGFHNLQYLIHCCINFTYFHTCIDTMKIDLYKSFLSSQVYLYCKFSTKGQFKVPYIIKTQDNKYKNKIKNIIMWWQNK